MSARKKKRSAPKPVVKRRPPSVLRSAVQTCLDTQIRAWRLRRAVAANPHDADQADDSIAAFQLVRTDLLGKALAEEPLPEVPETVIVL